MLPYAIEDATPYWHAVADAVGRGERLCLAALVDGLVVGTAQLTFAAMPNQPHRADVSKLLVHRAARNHGLGTALMHQLEIEAALHGRSLLVLDTAVGGGAEALYERWAGSRWARCRAMRCGPTAASARRASTGSG